MKYQCDVLRAEMSENKNVFVTLVFEKWQRERVHMCKEESNP